MRKFVSSLLALIILVSLMSVSAFAAGDGEIVLKASQSSLSAGDTFDVQVIMTKNPGFIVLLMHISYDDGLELVEVTDAGNYLDHIHGDNYLKNPFVLYWNNNLLTNNITKTELMATLTFRVKEGVPSGAYTIGGYHGDKDSANTNIETVRFTIVPCTVNVANNRNDGSDVILPIPPSDIVIGDSGMTTDIIVEDPVEHTVGEIG